MCVYVCVSVSLVGESLHCCSFFLSFFFAAPPYVCRSLRIHQCPHTITLRVSLTEKCAFLFFFLFLLVIYSAHALPSLLLYANFRYITISAKRLDCRLNEPVRGTALGSSSSFIDVKPLCVFVCAFLFFLPEYVSLDCRARLLRCYQAEPLGSLACFFFLCSPART